MRRLVLLSLAVVCIACTASGTRSGSVPGSDTIRAEDLRADLYYVASDAMGGRLTQTTENRIAAEFIASRFARLGLQPGAGDSYFDDYDLMTFEAGNDNGLGAEVDGSRLVARGDTDAVPMMFSASATAEGALVFGGFSIVSEPLGYDDYRGADLTGSIVLVLDHEPGEDDPDSPFDGVVASESSRDWRKALAAQQHGAAGILFVRDVHNHEADETAAALSSSFTRRGIPRYAVAAQIERVDIPAMRVTPQFAQRLLGERDLTQLATESEESPGPVAIAGTTVRMSAEVSRTRVPDRNVVGLIRGSDPELADELVIVCAHYDHDGRNGERIFNGADDDGSGTVAVIEIAEAYAAAAAAGIRPRRSVLFAVWNSEERGLLGAWGWIESARFDPSNTVAVLNMDMIGRNEEVPADGGRRFRGLQPQTAEENANTVHLMGYAYSSMLTDVAQHANEPIGLDLELQYDNNSAQLLRRSDHWPFLQVGIPALFFHTGLHPDYHRETDTPDRINYAKYERIVRLVHAVSWRIANADERPRQDGHRGTL